MKKVLLIAGGGAIGSYVSKELIEKGHCVDVICLEEKLSYNEHLRFYRQKVDFAYLKEFLKNKYYDAIVNFLHYTSDEKYKPYHELLSAKTDQLVFLSSYRVYADLEHPVTENAPLLSEVSTDKFFLENEPYSMGKTKCEGYIKNKSGTENWTIVRPVISFAGNRFDVVMHTERTVVNAAKSGTTLLLPKGAEKQVAGLDWAGNSGKIIANLLFKKECLKECYTISSGQNPTWEDIANWYTELLGVKFNWIDDKEYESTITDTVTERYRLIYDRMFNRDVDCTKVLKASGLKSSDFLPIKEAIKAELRKIGAIS